MELEREPRKYRKSQSSETRTTPSQPSKTSASLHSPEWISNKRPFATREICIVVGLLLFTVSLVGLVTGGVFGTHLTYNLSTAYFGVGLISVLVGAFYSKISVPFAWIMTAIFGLMGIMGFIMGSSSVDKLWVISSDRLILGTADHCLNLLIAAGFLIAAAFSKRNISESPIRF